MCFPSAPVGKKKDIASSVLTPCHFTAENLVEVADSIVVSTFK